MTCILQTPTPDLERSKAFYQSLGFQSIAHESLTLYTDGKVLIRINPERTARAGIRIYQDDWHDEVGQLKQHAVVHEKDGVFVLADPGNSWIYLETGATPVDFTPAEQSTSALGNSMGI